MISNRPGSNEEIMDIFAKRNGTDFVTLEFSNMGGYLVPILKTYSRQKNIFTLGCSEIPVCASRW